MNPTLSKSARARGFSLVELLAVVAVIAILVALAAAPATSLMGSNRLNIAASQVSDLFDRARQLALVRNRPVEVRFLSKSADAPISAIQLWWGSVPVEPADKAVVLPERVSVLETNGLSPWLGAMPAATMPAGSGVYAGWSYRAATVRPSGEARPVPVGGSGGMYVTLASDLSSDDLPENFATIQINPHSTRPMVYRP